MWNFCVCAVTVHSAAVKVTLISNARVFCAVCPVQGMYSMLCANREALGQAGTSYAKNVPQ